MHECEFPSALVPRCTLTASSWAVLAPPVPQLTHWTHPLDSTPHTVCHKQFLQTSNDDTGTFELFLVQYRNLSSQSWELSYGSCSLDGKNFPWMVQIFTTSLCSRDTPYFICAWRHFATKSSSSVQDWTA
jgi:hypothetical protein